MLTLISMIYVPRTGHRSTIIEKLKQKKIIVCLLIIIVELRLHLNEIMSRKLAIKKLYQESLLNKIYFKFRQLKTE